MISYETSQEIMKNLTLGRVKSEQIFLTQSLGRILSKDSVAQSDSPTHPTSAMDGYAIRHSDLATYTSLEILGDNPAGSESIGGVGRGGRRRHRVSGPATTALLGRAIHRG